MGKAAFVNFHSSPHQYSSKTVYWIQQFTNNYSNQSLADSFVGSCRLMGSPANTFFFEEETSNMQETIPKEKKRFRRYQVEQKTFQAKTLQTFCRNA